MVPAQTSDIGRLVTGKDSPVRLLSSTSLYPSTTTPSTGTTSPARTATTSPTLTSRAPTTSPARAVSRNLRPDVKRKMRPLFSSLQPSSVAINDVVQCTRWVSLSSPPWPASTVADGVV
nr:unnamed protein product [Digitaria exilis]